MSLRIVLSRNLNLIKIQYINHEYILSEVRKTHIGHHRRSPSEETVCAHNIFLYLIICKNYNCPKSILLDCWNIPYSNGTARTRMENIIVL